MRAKRLPLSPIRNDFLCRDSLCVRLWDPFRKRSKCCSYLFGRGNIGDKFKLVSISGLKHKFDLSFLRICSALRKSCYAIDCRHYVRSLDRLAASRIAMAGAGVIARPRPGMPQF